MKKVKIEVSYDPVVKRFKAHCPECGYFAARAKREAAVHATAQHVAYTHDGVEVKS